MLDIHLDPGGQPVDRSLPCHIAMETVLRRLLAGADTCGCATPLIRIVVSDAWRSGGLRILSVDACCDDAVNGLRRITPRTLLAHTRIAARPKEGERAALAL
ncbi:MAG: hypothetical protein ACO1SV_18320 [Fimbriimonas sp.]